MPRRTTSTLRTVLPRRTGAVFAVCFWPTCDERIERSRLACKSHWLMIPSRLRAAYNEARGDCQDPRAATGRFADVINEIKATAKRRQVAIEAGVR